MLAYFRQQINVILINKNKMREQSVKQDNILLQAMKQHRKRIGFYRYNDILRQAKSNKNQRDSTFLKQLSHICLGNESAVQTNDASIGLSSDLHIQMPNYASTNYQYHKGSQFVSPANVTQSDKEKKYFSCQTPSKSDIQQFDHKLTNYCSIVLNTHMSQSNQVSSKTKTKSSSAGKKKIKLYKQFLPEEQKNNQNGQKISQFANPAIATKSLGKLGKGSRSYKQIKTE